MSSQTSWQSAFDLWLASLRSEHTRRAYGQAFADLQRFRGNADLQAVNRSDVARWMEDMRARGLSAPTIAQRLAAVSAFYRYAEFTFEDLQQKNPAAVKDRPKVTPYGKANYLSANEARALLRAINRKTLQGRRDYALFLGYLFTGRRNSEWRRVRWGDFVNKGSKVMYRWSGKGKSDVLSELPPPVWNSILELLKADGRHATIQPGDYVFAPFADPLRRKTGWDTSRPVGDREVLQLMKRYGKRAGLNPVNLKVHMLRHSATMLRKEAGDDVETICKFLGHSNIAITQIYLHQVEGRADQSWMSVAQMLGI